MLLFIRGNAEPVDMKLLRGEREVEVRSVAIGGERHRARSNRILA
jgi:hypothetical protein